MRILLVEDELSLREAIKLNLDLEGYEVVSVADGREALKTYGLQHFDLIILDVMIPHIDGFAVCEQIRLTDLKTPIIFLTAKDTAQDRVQGLKIGADDYLNKPFHLEELLLRIKNVLRRSNPTLHEELAKFTFGSNAINFSNYQASNKEGVIDLTKREAKLLKLLTDKKNLVVSRQEILQSVWGYDVYPSTRTIDNFILAFRKYFEEDPKNPIYFISVRGVGYKFTMTK